MDNEIKLTLKQRKFIKFYLETGNASEASRRAGYANDRQQGCQNLTKLNIRQAFMTLLDKKGLTDEKIIDIKFCFFCYADWSELRIFVKNGCDRCRLCMDSGVCNLCYTDDSLPAFQQNTGSFQMKEISKVL